MLLGPSPLDYLTLHIDSSESVNVGSSPKGIIETTYVHYSGKKGSKCYESFDFRSVICGFFLSMVTIRAISAGCTVSATAAGP